MDFGHLLFDEPVAVDPALPATEYDFYGAFMHSGHDVVDVGPGSAGDVTLVSHHASQSLAPRSAAARRNPYSDVQDLGYLADQDSSASVAAARALPHQQHQNLQYLTTSLLDPAAGRDTRPSPSGRLSPLPSKMAVATTASPSSEPRLATLRTLMLADDAAAANPAGASASNKREGRLERRGHTKSRRGCFNCKRRRIKCQETRPACGHCAKTGLQCEYPVAPLINHQPQHQIPLFSLQDMRFFQHFLDNCSPLHQPLGNESLWTHEIPCLSHSYDYLMHALLGMAASDLMHQDPSLVTAAMDHRLKAIRAIKRTLAAVPKWPANPQHHHGTAAQCADVGGRSCSASPGASGGGSGRRSRARSGSGSGSGSGSVSGAGEGAAPAAAAAPDPYGSGMGTTPMFEEGNALMATCFALTFQSVALDDGMAEYMTFIRGIIVVAIQMYLKGARILFRNLLGNEQTELLRPAIEPMEGIDRRWSTAAVAAVRNLAPLCHGDAVATTYHALVLEMAEALLVSPMEGTSFSLLSSPFPSSLPPLTTQAAYSAMTRHYAWWMQLPHEQFRQVIDLDQQVFVLLAAHWIALKQIMTRIAAKTDVVSQAVSGSSGNTAARASRTTAADGSMEPGMLRWLKHLNRQVEPEYQAYNEWPVWVEAELARDPTAFGRE